MPDILTLHDYEEYQAAVRAFWMREGLKFFSSKPTNDGDSPEPYFSWHPCDCCGSHLGGNREDYIGIDAHGPIEYSICEDCVYYNEYGRLDDMTMARIAVRP